MFIHGKVFAARTLNSFAILRYFLAFLSLENFWINLNRIRRAAILERGSSGSFTRKSKAFTSSRSLPTIHRNCGLAPTAIRKSPDLSLQSIRQMAQRGQHRIIIKSFLSKFRGRLLWSLPENITLKRSINNQRVVAMFRYSGKNQMQKRLKLFKASTYLCMWTIEICTKKGLSKKLIFTAMRHREFLAIPKEN